MQTWTVIFPHLKKRNVKLYLSHFWWNHCSIVAPITMEQMLSSAILSFLQAEVSRTRPAAQEYSSVTEIQQRQSEFWAEETSSQRPQAAASWLEAAETEVLDIRGCGSGCCRSLDIQTRFFFCTKYLSIHLYLYIYVCVDWAVVMAGSLRWIYANFTLLQESFPPPPAPPRVGASLKFCCWSSINCQQ